MRALFLFLRVVASLISMSFVGLGLLYTVLACWLVWQLPKSGAELSGLVGMAGFGALMVYLGGRVLIEQGRMFSTWWHVARRERDLPQARVIVRSARARVRAGVRAGIRDRAGAHRRPRPLRGTPGRGGRSSGTCRSWRTPAIAPRHR